MFAYILLIYIPFILVYLRFIENAKRADIWGVQLEKHTNGASENEGSKQLT